MTAPMVLDGAMHGSAFPRLCRTGFDAHAVSRRHRRDGQSAGSQAGRCPASESNVLGPSFASCRRIAGLQSDRNGVLEIQSLHEEVAARTVDDLWNAITEAIDLFTPKECENYFAAAGYDRE